MQGCFKPICHDACVYRGHYAPDIHVLRHCDRCAVWYHRECLDRVAAPAPTLFDRPRERVRSDASERSKLYWERLLLTPIERGNRRGAKTFLSYELLITALREQENRWGCPVEGPWAWVCAQLGEDPRSGEAQEAKRFLDMHRPGVLYSCRKCEDVI